VHITLQRIGPHVTFNLYVRQFDRAGVPNGAVLFTLPPGFRPRASYRVAAELPSTAQLTVATNGTVTLHVGDIPANAFVTINFAHFTGDQPPVLPPGSAA
jgi:hypothetical protein